jgi:hypothetical protein
MMLKKSLKNDYLILHLDRWYHDLKLQIIYSLKLIIFNFWFDFRAIKVIETLQKLISDFTIDDPTNPLLFEKLENIRAKFKQVNSLITLYWLILDWR